ncbi:Queuine tRNA-ribosyltransferase accessory subunit 2 [Holothuria leucospilota]|uniref:Queuine tRNA-ribosyltransferase accessory subunit 2 n=1 Tax=Holothuria leucospilota TaxID=206669 RepID=A0A9Q1C4L1_HOLLE|nr:Queuine tRNA-ribosyltransferase accessory subunit 2 [Holothuria leucospilota]
MKFTVDTVSKEGCRLSFISKIGHHEDTIIETPSCMMYTRGGSVPHLTLDMVQKIPHQSGIVQLTVPSFIEYRQTLDTFQDGLAKFAGLPAKGVTFLSIQDPCTTVPSGYNGKDAVSVWAPSGRVKLNATSFMSFERSSRPDIFQALCDGDTPEGCSKKRICKAVDRTLAFLDECLEQNIKTEQDSDPAAILGVIEGGDLLSERLRSAKETAKRPVSGFILDCFGESF